MLYSDKLNLKVDYQHSIVSVSSSILKHFGVPAEHPSLELLDNCLKKNYTNIVLMIIDCMGSEIVRQNLPQNSFIRQHIRCDISSVFPPTTTAATTAYHSALMPVESGWLAWACYFSQYDKIVELFLNKEHYTGRALMTPSPADSVLSYESIYQKIVRCNPNVQYHKIFPPFDENGAHSFAELCERVMKISAHDSQKKIISAYWHEPDHSIHTYGTSTPEIKQVLKDIDSQLQKMCSKLKDTIVIISADHGAVDNEEIYLNEYPDICETLQILPSLESRFTTFFVKPEYKDKFPALFEKYFTHDFVLFTKQQFLQSHLLGDAKPHPQTLSFLGDYVSVAVTDKSLCYCPEGQEREVMKGHHAGFTKQEMTIPLLILEYK